MTRLLPRLVLLSVALCYVAIVAWGCAEIPLSPALFALTSSYCGGGGDSQCAAGSSCTENSACAPYCRAPFPGEPNPCEEEGFFCDADPGLQGQCIQCDEEHPCASGTCDEKGVCGGQSQAGYEETLLCDLRESCARAAPGPLGSAFAPALVSPTTAPSFATSPNPSLQLSSEESGAHPALTLSYDFIAGELRTHYANLFLPASFGVDLVPPLTCGSDEECPGGTCTSNACVPLACSSDPDCPSFGMAGENELPGFCFTPPGGSPSSCRVSCSTTPTAPVGGSCPGVDDCPTGTTCTVLDDETCGCAPLPEVGRELGVLGLDAGIDGTIDLLAPVLSYDDRTVFIDLDGDASIEGDPVLLHRGATTVLAHRLAIFVPPADDPLDPGPFIPEAVRTYLILESGILTNPVAGGAFEPELELHSVDPESGGFDDGSGLVPQEATFSMPLLIASPIFADGFESGDVTAWTAQAP